MIINHNMSAMFAQRTLGQTNVYTQKNIEKLSSGLRINRAGDDASGLAVSEKMRSQIRGLNRASANAQDGISFIQVAEAFLQETTDVMQRIRELSVQSSNGIYSAEDRLYTVTASMWFHIGANMDQRVRAYVGTMTAKALGVRDIGDESILTIDTPETANRAIGTIDEAIKKINKQRADLGAYQNRLEMSVVGINVAAENLQASESRIRDVDMAKEMVEFTRNQILTQSGTAMLAQANQQTQSVMSLLR